MRRKYICDRSMRHVQPCEPTANKEFCACGCEPDWTCVAWNEYAKSVFDDGEDAARDLERRRRRGNAFPD